MGHTNDGTYQPNDLVGLFSSHVQGAGLSGLSTRKVYQFTLYLFINVCDRYIQEGLVEPEI